MLVKPSAAMSDAMNQGLGCRPRQVNLMTDASGSIGYLKHCRQHLKRWMKHENRSSGDNWGRGKIYIYFVPFNRDGINERKSGL